NVLGAALVALRALARFVELASEAALATSGRVLVQDALLGGLVDALDRGMDGLVCVLAFLDRAERALGASVQLGADLTVASVALFGLPIALDLRLDVCHEYLLIFAEGSARKNEVKRIR
ncbi:MAG: hypothetical protein ACI9MX_004075, partial [Candidatus Aldehydirespiratoraceae bacterium]